MQKRPCLCCGTPLLRHVRNSGPYWYCPACADEMPAAKVKPLLSGNSLLSQVVRSPSSAVVAQ